MASSLYEVRITKSVERNMFNVDLVSWGRDGSGVAHGKAFKVNRKAADKEAARVADLYNAKIVDKTKGE
jgi:hypothetical protein